MRNLTTVQPHISVRDFLSGMVVGGLAGAAVAFLTAPQAGKKTRAQLLRKTGQLRDQAAGKVEYAWEQAEDVVEQAVAKGQQVREETAATVEKLGQRGQALIEDRIDRAEALLETLRPGRG